MATRIKVKVAELTIDDVERISGEIVEAKNKLDADTAAMNEELDAVRKNHVEDQTNLAVEIDAKARQLEQWAKAHPELFERSRSINLTRAVVGFRKGQWQVATAKGVTQAAAAEKLARSAAGKLFIRFSPAALNKEVILEKREALPKAVTAAGVVVIQEETFFVEPKQDKPAEVAG